MAERSRVIEIFITLIVPPSSYLSKISYEPMQVKVLSRKLRELTDLVWVKSLTRQGQKLDLHTISSHFTQFAGKYLRTKVLASD